MNLVSRLLKWVSGGRHVVSRQDDPPALAGATPQPSVDVAFPASMTVRPRPELVTAEDSAKEEAFCVLLDRLTESGLFLPERIPDMMRVIRAASPPLCPINASRLIFNPLKAGKDREERIPIGECVDAQARLKIDPEDFLSYLCMQMQARATANRSLADARTKGIEKVVLICVEQTACSKAKRIKKRYAIEDAPTLPLDGCKARRCHCIYQSIIPGL